MGNTILTFEYSIIRLKWFARVDGKDAFGVGITQAEALADLVMNHKELFGIEEFHVVLLAKEGNKVIV